MPTAAAQGIDIVIGGPYNSGILAGGTRFEYQNAPAEITAKVARITDIAQRYDVPIKAAALQFSLAHPATAAVIPGASKPERIAEDYAALNTTIPDGTNCVINTSSPPTRRCPWTTSRGTAGRKSSHPNPARAHDDPCVADQSSVCVSCVGGQGNDDFLVADFSLSCHL